MVLLEGNQKEQSIQIPFNDWRKERISMAIKECTSRHKKYTEDKRVTYITPRLPLWFIAKYFWKQEGAYSPEEFRREVNKIYNREVPDDEMFYIHFGDFQ